MTFEEYVKGKKIALVGPSDQLIGSNLGEEIDNHDIVVRMNKAIPIPEKYKKDFGVRSDILCNCLDQHPRTGGVISPELWKDSGVKFVLTPFPLETQRNGTILNLISRVKKYIEVQYIPLEQHNENIKNLLAAPTTGFSSLIYLLSLDIKNLSLYGIDFYRSLPYKEYFHGRVDWGEVVDSIESHKKEAKEFLGKQYIGHNIDSEFNYFKDNLYKNPKIIIDDNLRKYLE